MGDISCQVAQGNVFRHGLVYPEMVMLPPGEFWMGSMDDEGEPDEWPRHRVSIGHSFALGKYLVTFEEFDHFVQAIGYEHSPGDFGWGRERRPVVDVSWLDAQAYCHWLSVQTGQKYRLPGEAEWEYACRAGGTHKYSGSDDIDAVAWYAGNSGGKSHPVGLKAANTFGFHDMSGNVWEWLMDRWNEGYLGAPADGRSWQRGPYLRRVLRGGSWLDDAQGSRSAFRLKSGVGGRSHRLGFRVAVSLPSDGKGKITT